MTTKINRGSVLVTAVAFSLASFMSSCTTEETSVTDEIILEDSNALDQTAMRPIAQNDFGVNASVGETVIIDVLANDFDPNGGELTITNVFPAGGAGVHDIEVINDRQIKFTRRDRTQGGFIYYSAVNSAGLRDQALVRIPSVINSNG